MKLFVAYTHQRNNWNVFENDVLDWSEIESFEDVIELQERISLDNETYENIKVINWKVL